MSFSELFNVFFRKIRNNFHKNFSFLDCFKGKMVYTAKKALNRGLLNKLTVYNCVNTAKMKSIYKNTSRNEK